MSQNESIKSDYFMSTQQLLQNHPDELKSFEKLWSDGQIREAYISADGVVKNLKLVRSKENQKIDEDFFWVFMH